MIVVCSTIAFAQLADFPDNYISGNKFDGYLVVGKDGTSTDVLSQSMLGLKIQSYMESLQKGINQLDTDVDINNNLILIGNPCVNTLTAELLDNPDPCDKDFPLGKAYIKYYTKNDYHYIVVAGNNDVGTKRAAQELTDFDVNNLKGSEIVIDLPSQVQSNEPSAMPEDEDIAPVPELYEEDGTEEAQNNENVIMPISADTETTEDESQDPEPQVILVEDKGIFQKAWAWFIGLFGK